MAVPLAEYEAVLSMQDVLKHKNADFIDRNAKMALRMSKL